MINANRNRKEYRHKWYMEHKEFNAIRSRKWHRLHPEKTKFFALKKRSRMLSMPFTITKDEFSEWYLKSEKKCTYCDLVNLRLESKLSRGRSLLFFTIDRKNPSLPYSIENICFSCWTCNRLKSDVFSHDEWLEIAQKFIKPKWLKRVEVTA